MNDLLAKYNDYMRLVGCRVEYYLSDGEIISFKYVEEGFVHLVGLHKLKDLRLIQGFNDKSNKKVKTANVIKQIKSEKFGDNEVRRSIFFNVIKDRYEKFSYETLTMLNYTDAIIDFNPSVIKSKIKSDYLLFENRNGGFNHLGIAKDKTNGNRYVETYFQQKTDMYVKGQKIVPVRAFAIFTPEGDVLVEDSF